MNGPPRSFRIPFGPGTRAQLAGARGRVDLAGSHVKVRLGPFFSTTIPLGAIRSAVPVRTRRWTPVGASERGGTWTVHGRAGEAVELRLQPAASARAGGSSVRIGRLVVGVDDVTGLLEALGHPRRQVLRYEASGCVVVRDDGRVMVLHREGEVRLPKGHIDPGEVPEETALRELAEESGHDHVELLAPVGVGPVAFDRFDRDDGTPVRIERTEHWFLARLLSGRTVARPPEDEAFVVAWLGWDDAVSALTYAGEAAWAARARAVLDALDG